MKHQKAKRSALYARWDVGNVAIPMDNEVIKLANTYDRTKAAQIRILVRRALDAGLGKE